MTSRKRRFLPLLLIVLVGCNGGNASSGDRVLVNKFQYDLVNSPERFDVVVFKYPGGPHGGGPVEDGVPKNYIKRLLGLSGEIIAIFFGQLFFWQPGPGGPLPFAEEDKDIDPLRQWEIIYTHEARFHLTGSEDQGIPAKMKQWFETPDKFQIIRKTPEVMLAMRRIVYDNDFQPKDLKGIKRWAADGWSTGDGLTFAAAGSSKDKTATLRYQHLVVPRGDGVMGAPAEWDPKPQLITDFTSYNAFKEYNEFGPPVDRTPDENWTGDLMLECNLEVKKAEGEFDLELNRGVNRVRARWDLATGMCTLERSSSGGPWEKIGKPKATAVKAPGNYELRFANFDARLVVWVNGSLPFAETEGDYPPAELPRKGESVKELIERLGPTESDLQPASIGAKGADIAVSHLRLWRDTYYTLGEGAEGHAVSWEHWGDPDNWKPLRNMPVKTMYVQPGHYMCLGDNSTASSDSRSWGVVPERLMLGRALMVYFPVSRIGPIH